MKKVTQYTLAKKNAQEGASLIEYAVIAALVVALAVAGFATLGGGLTTAFNNIVTTLSGA